MTSRFFKIKAARHVSDMVLSHKGLRCLTRHSVGTRLSRTAGDLLGFLTHVRTAAA